MNQSFTAVGAYSTGGAAYTTGEVNLTAGDRPLRVRSISVDAHLLKALSIQPGADADHGYNVYLIDSVKVISRPG